MVWLVITNSLLAIQYLTLRSTKLITSGRPDCARSARVVLKDYVNGKLLFSHSPEGLDPAVYYEDDDDESVVASAALSDCGSCPEDRSGIDDCGSSKNLAGKRKLVGARTTETDQIDREFFASERSGFGTRGKKQADCAAPPGADGKPWKKHNNRNKKEKLRRVYGYLDQ